MIGRRSNVLKVTQALSTDQNITVFSRKKSLPQKPAAGN